MTKRPTVGTGVAVDANNIPLAIGYIAAYAKVHLGEAIDARLFKYPEIAYIESRVKSPLSGATVSSDTATLKI